MENNITTKDYREQVQSCLDALLDDETYLIPDTQPKEFYMQLSNCLVESVTDNLIPLERQVNLVDRCLSCFQIDYSKLLEAIAMLDKKLPHNNIILGLFARTNFLAGNHLEAVRWFHRIEQEQLLDHYIGGSDDEEFVPYLKSVCLFEGGEEQGLEDWLTRAMVARSEGKYEEGKRLMDMALIEKPHSTSYQFHRGWFSWKLGEAEDAFAWFCKVLDKTDREDDVIEKEICDYYEPFIYVYFNQAEKALELVDKALKKDRNNNLFLAAEIYSLLGNLQESYQYLEESFANGGAPWVNTLLTDPALENLRKTAQGRKLIQDRVRHLQGQYKKTTAPSTRNNKKSSLTLKCEYSETEGILCSLCLMGDEIRFVVDTGSPTTLYAGATPILANAYLEEVHCPFSEGTYKGQWMTVLPDYHGPLIGTAALLSDLPYNIFGTNSMVAFDKIILKGNINDESILTHLPFRYFDGMICIRLHTKIALETIGSDEYDEAMVDCIIDTALTYNMMPTIIVGNMLGIDCEMYDGHGITLNLSDGQRNETFEFYIHNDKYRPNTRLGLPFIRCYSTFVLDIANMEVLVG